MDCYKFCQAGLEGNYRDKSFFKDDDYDDSQAFSLKKSSTIARIRAAVQYANTTFADEFRKKGHKYHFTTTESTTQGASKTGRPQDMTQNESLKWVRNMVLRSRGCELVGSFNPNVIAELFWEQSEPWERLATSHVQEVGKLCEKFLSHMLEQVAPKDLKPRIW